MVCKLDYKLCDIAAADSWRKTPYDGVSKAHAASGVPDQATPSTFAGQSGLESQRDLGTFGEIDVA